MAVLYTGVTIDCHRNLLEPVIHRKLLETYLIVESHLFELGDHMGWHPLTVLVNTAALLVLRPNIGAPTIIELLTPSMLVLSYSSISVQI